MKFDPTYIVPYLHLIGGALHYRAASQYGTRLPEQRLAYFDAPSGVVVLLPRIDRAEGVPLRVERTDAASLAADAWSVLPGEQVCSSGPFYAEQQPDNGDIVAVWLSTPCVGWISHPQKLFLRDGKLHKMFAVLDGRTLFRWSDATPLAGPSDDHLRAIWKQRDSLPSVRRVRTGGRGYSGGHNTADTRGWPVIHPEPHTEAVLSWDDTEQGRFTGFYPAGVNLVPVRVPA